MSSTVTPTGNSYAYRFPGAGAPDPANAIRLAVSAALSCAYGHDMRIRIVDAFTDRPFTGNPAGVLLLDSFPADEWLQNVAKEVNLSETSFAHPLAAGGAADWALRWFTPTTEVDMCGHATLAAAHVLSSTGAASGIVRFAARCGILSATVQESGTITLDFPTSPLTSAMVPDGLPAALGTKVVAVLETGLHVGDLLVEVEDEKAVRELSPDFGALIAHARRGVIVTATAARPRMRLRLRLALFLPGRRHRRGPGDRQLPHSARPVLVGQAGTRRTHRPPGLGPLRPRQDHAARRAHPAHRHRGHRHRRRTARVSVTVLVTLMCGLMWWRPAVRQQCRTAPSGRSETGPHAVGSQPTFPASSA